MRPIRVDIGRKRLFQKSKWQTRDEIRPSDPDRVPSDFQLNGLALFGFCREAIRRRVKPLVRCFCKRREED